MNFRDSGYALTYLGLAGIVFVTILGLEYAPGLKPNDRVHRLVTDHEKRRWNSGDEQYPPRVRVGVDCPRGLCRKTGERNKIPKGSRRRSRSLRRS